MDSCKTLSFSDGCKIGQPLVFQTMVKPIGSTCNLKCKYCYYLGKSRLYDGKEPIMSDKLLELYIKQYIEGNETDTVTFNWHGGEPLMAGLDFYKKAMKLQKQYSGSKKIENTLQTNATLISEDWAHFFKDNNFLIGVSIDGPKSIHDRMRISKGESGTWEKAIRGIGILYRNGVEYNTLSTINKYNENQGVEIYQFLKTIRSSYMQFLPVFEHVSSSSIGQKQHIVSPQESKSELAPWSVSAEGFGQFVCDIFDEWIKQDVGNIYVQLFDATLAKYVGAPSGICIFEDTCGDNIVVEHNGDVYSCDHFVYSKDKLGNIKENSLREMVLGRKQFDFGINKRDSLPRQCLRCEYSFACKGECPKHRFDISKDGEPYLNGLCKGYKMFYEHTKPYMVFMANELSHHRAPANVMRFRKDQLV
jgi:anaerobic sulfatase-maturating enzyme